MLSFNSGGLSASGLGVLQSSKSLGIIDLDVMYSQFVFNQWQRLGSCCHPSYFANRKNQLQITKIKVDVLCVLPTAFGYTNKPAALSLRFVTKTNFLCIHTRHQ